jgi:MarR-like DNA-binding transcriptional regulator SgrR of sgrS sRNA
VNSSLASTTSNEILIPLSTSKISLDPTYVQDTASLWVARQVNCQLFRLKGKTAELEAAQSIRYLSPTSVQIELAEGIRFHDGTPVLADDVVASFDYLKKSRRVLRSVFDRIDHIKIAGPKNLIIVLKRPFPQIAEFLGAPNYAIFNKKFIEKAKRDVSLWNAPLGCGAYRVASTNSRSNEIKLLPIKLGLPIRFVLNTDGKITDEVLNSATILDTPFIRTTETPTGMVESKTFDPRQIFLVLNTRLKRWKDQSHRCELFRKIDRSTILKAYPGTARLASSIFPQGVVGYHAEKFQWNDTLNKNTESLRHDSKFRLTILGISVDAEHRNAYVEMLKAVLPDTQLEIMGSTVRFGETFTQSGSDGLIVGLKSNFFDGYEFLLPFVEPTANVTGIEDRDLSKLIHSSQTVSLPRERAQIYQLAEQKILNDCMMYPLITVPDRRVLLRSGWEFPLIGQVPINEYFLGKVRKQ